VLVRERDAQILGRDRPEHSHDSIGHRGKMVEQAIVKYFARQAFGPMNSSMSSTLSRRATEMSLWVIRRQLTPTRAHVSVKSALMSADSLVKKYRA